MSECVDVSALDGDEAGSVAAEGDVRGSGHNRTEVVDNVKQTTTAGNLFVCRWGPIHINDGHWLGQGDNPVFVCIVVIDGRSTVLNNLSLSLR